MGSREIFFRRLIKGWKYQYRVFQAIADWTVMLYIIIPAAFISSFIYRSWWIETPVWIENIPFFLLFFLLYLLSWNGYIRTLVEEADKVFLVKKPQMFFGMKKWGYTYSLLFQALANGAAILILLPFLIRYYLLEWQQVFALLLYFIALNSLTILVKFYLGKIEKKIKRILSGIFLFVSLSWFNQLIYFIWENGYLFLVCLLGMVIMVISIYVSIRTLLKLEWIEYEIERGQVEKMQYIQHIFMMSPEIERPVVIQRTKPLFFRKSGRIFRKRTPENGFIELAMKVFIRNPVYVKGYFQMISITTAALSLIPPLWIKILIFTVFLIMMYSWLSLIWDKIMGSNPLTQKYRESTFYFSARSKAILITSIATILLMLIISTCVIVLLQ